MGEQHATLLSHQGSFGFDGTAFEFSEWVDYQERLHGSGPLLPASKMEVHGLRTAET